MSKLFLGLLIFVIASSCHGNDEESHELKLYRKLFRLKRKEHIAVVQKLLLVDGIEKQASFIQLSMNQIIKTIEESQATLSSHKYKAGKTFPVENSARDALSLILENTSLFTDLIVRFPKLGRYFFQQNRMKWLRVMEPAIKTCNATGVYEGDHQMILFALQHELGIGEKDINYINPFLEESISQVPLTAEERQKLYKEEKKAKKKLNSKQRTGPRLSKHTEL
uniref:Coiled-coil domain-containing protein 134 n=1 Tax=Ciona savignyi TaxID=51511 RepID=H2Z5M6_CIOSA